MRRAVRFPAGVSEYESTAALLSALSQFGRRYFGFSEVFAATAAVWVLSDWVPEFFAASPTLNISGCSMADAIRFFRFLRALCRRAIIVPDFSMRLPIDLSPTLLLVSVGLSKKARAFRRVSGFNGVYVPGHGGALQEPACPKAIYYENEDDDEADLESDEALRLVLLPIAGLPTLTDIELEAMAAQFQPQLELYRLRRLTAESQRAPTGFPVGFTRSALGAELLTLLGDEPEVTKFLLPVLDGLQQTSATRRSLDPLAVIIEVIWSPAHTEQQISPTEVMKRVNALLSARGETIEYSSREIGWKLTDLGLPRSRTANSMVLRFSRELREQAHVLARNFDLTLPVIRGCPDCPRPQAVES